MAVFQDITLTWDEETYTIAGNKILPLIAKIEGIVTLIELARAESTGAVPLARLATAYSLALRYAGATVEDAEVYKEMLSSGTKGLTIAVQGLLALMIPEDAKAAMQMRGKRKPRSNKRAGAKRSKSSTKSA